MLSKEIKQIKTEDLNKYLLPSSNENLKKIKQIYYTGNLEKCNDLKIAIVGSRQMTTYGKKIAYEISSRVAAAGVTVVSGLMYGIDMIAHQSALDAGGRTVAVLGYGFDHLQKITYSHTLVNQILNSKESAIISQFHPSDPPAKWTFPSRNLLMVLLCKTVILIEAGKNSGTLITANYALEEGRDVYCVPGSIYSSNSYGTNQLIKIGATPITSIDDLMIDLNLRQGPKANLNLNDIQQRLYGTLIKLNQRQGHFNSGIDLDEFYEHALNDYEINLNDFIQTLLELEIIGLIKKDISGKLFLV